MGGRVGFAERPPGRTARKTSQIYINYIYLE